jgi:hypothetical protein
MSVYRLQTKELFQTLLGGFTVFIARLVVFAFVLFILYCKPSVSRDSFHLPIIRLAGEGLNLSETPILEPIIEVTPDLLLTVDKAPARVLKVTESITLFSNQPEARIHYTTDGTEPTTASVLYTEPLFPNRDFIGRSITARAFLGEVSSNVLILNYFFPYHKSGQKVCYNLATEVLEDCTDAHLSQDGWLKLGLDIEYVSPQAPPEYPSDFVTRDLSFGLVWKTCAEGQTGATCTGTPSTFLGHTPDLENVCEQLNSANSGNGYAGLRTWRLPFRRELVRLLSFDTTAVDTTLFPANPTALWASDHVGTSRQRLVFNTRLWSSRPMTDSLAVRCVAGSSSAPPPVPRDMGDGTVQDPIYGLIWTKCTNGQTPPTCSGTGIPLKFPEALDYCDKLTLANKKWRLPNVVEIDIMLETTGTAQPHLYGKELFETSTFTGSYPTYLLTSTSNGSTMIRSANLQNGGVTSGGVLVKTNAFPFYCVTNLVP